MSGMGTEWYALVADSFALATGLLSGAIFFAGLWWTVRAGTAARNPGIWFPISLMLRASLLIAGFYYAATGGWQALVLCTGGFLTARAAIFRLVRVTSFNPHAS